MVTPLLDAGVSFAVVVLLLAIAWFLPAAVARRNDLADVAWGANAVLLAAVALALGDVAFDRLLAVALLVAVWGVRLALHVGSRLRRTAEDPRYAAWRAQWGEWATVRSLFQVFLLQSFLLLLVLAPLVVVTAERGGALGWTDAVGVLTWAAGLALETAADGQLARFLAHPANRGQLLTTGVWAWSRHPNYFGEVLLWWGVGIVAAASPLGAWALLGPAAITALILGVSGVPMKERRMQRYPGYDAYCRRTSRFLPWPPRLAP